MMAAYWGNDPMCPTKPSCGGSEPQLNNGKDRPNGGLRSELMQLNDAITTAESAVAEFDKTLSPVLRPTAECGAECIKERDVPPLSTMELYVQDLRRRLADTVGRLNYLRRQVEEAV